MSVLAYSELLKRIAGIEDRKLEQPFKILNENNTTATRLAALKGLALHEPVSVGKLLQSINLPRGGGSYLTVRKYFLALEGEGLLERTSNGNRTLWSFSKQGELLKRYIAG